MPPGATECDWSATSLESGRVGSQHERSDAQSFFEHVESLRKAGRGYAEVGHSGRPFPWLAVSFRDNNGVVHQFTSPGHCLLLRGDGSVDSDTVVEVPIYDEDHSFMGDYVSHGDRAWEVVQRFVTGAEPGLLGEWAET